MIPDHVASTEARPSPILWPRGLLSSFTADFALGGAALNDGTQGLQVQAWKTWSSTDAGGSIYVQPMDESQPAVQYLSGLGNIVMVSLAFDRNMRPAIAYSVQITLSDVRQYLHWFDTALNAMTTTYWPGIRDGRVAHDDTRDGQGSRSDIIFSYLKNGVDSSSLHWREQRDRYTIEYFVADDIPLTYRLRNTGMGRNLRFQWIVGKRNGAAIGS